MPGGRPASGKICNIRRQIGMPTASAGTPKMAVTPELSAPARRAVGSSNLQAEADSPTQLAGTPAATECPPGRRNRPHPTRKTPSRGSFPTCTSHRESDERHRATTARPCHRPTSGTRRQERWPTAPRADHHQARAAHRTSQTRSRTTSSTHSPSPDKQRELQIVAMTERPASHEKKGIA